MAKLLVLADILVDVLEFADLEQWLESVHRQQLDGLESMTLWRDAVDPRRHLLVSQYASGEQSSQALEWLADHPLIEQLRSQISVPEVTAAEILCRSGSGLGGPWISLVVAWAQAGYEDEKEQEFKDIQSELAYCAGFQGALLASNVATPQQLLSLATWNSAQNCRAAMPSQPVHDVRMLERLLQSS